MRRLATFWRHINRMPAFADIPAPLPVGVWRNGGRNTRRISRLIRRKHNRVRRMRGFITWSPWHIGYRRGRHRHIAAAPNPWWQINWVRRDARADGVGRDHDGVSWVKRGQHDGVSWDARADSVRRDDYGVCWNWRWQHDRVSRHTWGNCTRRYDYRVCREVRRQLDGVSWVTGRFFRDDRATPDCEGGVKYFTNDHYGFTGHVLCAFWVTVLDGFLLG